MRIVLDGDLSCSICNWILLLNVWKLLGNESKRELIVSKWDWLRDTWEHGRTFSSVLSQLVSQYEPTLRVASETTSIGKFMHLVDSARLSLALFVCACCECVRNDGMEWKAWSTNDLLFTHCFPHFVYKACWVRESVQLLLFSCCLTF